uniref:Uncharacterized protein n=1 Tax=Arundo donax TaxID=35708 RepID=A0A0A9C528_ARUDO
MGAGGRSNKYFLCFCIWDDWKCLFKITA